MKRHWMLWLARCGIGFFVVMAVFAPIIAPPSGNCWRDLMGESAPRALGVGEPAFWQILLLPPASCFQMTRFNFANQPVAPSANAPLGTVQGFDIRYGIVWGARTALLFGLGVVLINVLCGAIIGILAGYFGGVLDNLLMRFTDIVIAFPSLIITIVLVVVLGQNLFNIALAFILVGWTYYARLVRGEVLRIRHLQYIEAARALGVSEWRLLHKHVSPNALTNLLPLMMLDLGTIPLALGALSFLGLGTPPGFADWGQLIQLAQQWLQGPPNAPFAYWYVSLFPGLCILFYSLAWNLLGDALAQKKS